VQPGEQAAWHPERHYVARRRAEAIEPVRSASQRNPR
jgi:hypothetical protein